MKKRGFTMVELMIVIAIIAVLASIIMPKMSQNRAKTQLEACKVNLRNIVIAINLYMNDNQNQIPAAGVISSSHILVSRGYLKSRPVCPANPVSGNSYNFLASGAYVGDYYVQCLNSSRIWHPAMSDGRPLLYLGHGYLYN